MKSDSRSLPLAGVRVLEWAEGIPGPTAGWLLAECGADVLKVEPPRGDRLRSSLGFRVLNRGKRSVVIDVANEDERERFHGLAAAADVVIVDEVEERLDEAGIGYDASRWPTLLWCSAPMFPRDTPWHGLPPDDALAEAVGGVSAMQWSYGKSPVYFVTPMVSYATGFLAALGVAGALRARSLSRRGQRIDTSGLAAAMLLQSGTLVYGAGHEGSLASQANDPRGVFPTYGLYETADGWMFVGALTESFWTALATLLERTDLLTDPALQQTPMAFGRADIRDRLRAELEPLFRAETTTEWLRRFDASDIPGGRVQSRREALDEPNAIATGAVLEIDDPEVGTMRQAGAPVVFAGTLLDRSPSPAPRLDRNAPHGFGERAKPIVAAGRRLSAPLDGIRVLDLASFIAGPLCPMLLADLGADVIKIEAPSGDPFRIAAFGFEGWNRGKRSLVLDLKKPEGARAFRRLAATADVVVENFRPGVMERLGLGYATLAELNPRLVYTAISGFGPTGPESMRPGFDPVMQARSGFSRAQGGEGEPVLHQVAYTDYMTGTLAAFATVVALCEREHAGTGRRVDASLYRTAFAMQAGEIVECGGRMPEVRGGRDLLGRSAVYRAYAAGDGWLFIAATDARHVEALSAILDLELEPKRALGADPEDPIAVPIAAAVAARTRQRLLARLREAAVPAAPCLTFAEVVESPDLREARLICDVEHPLLGPLSTTGAFLRYSAMPSLLLRPAPALGAHSREMLGEAGFSAAEIEALIAAGVTRG